MPKFYKLQKFKMPKFKMFSRSMRLFSKNFITLIYGQVLLLIISIFILRPVISNIFHFALKASGYSYVTVNNLISFLINPVSLLIVGILLFIMGVFFLYDTYYFIIFLRIFKIIKSLNF